MGEPRTEAGGVLWNELRSHIGDDPHWRLRIAAIEAEAANLDVDLLKEAIRRAVDLDGWPDRPLAMRYFAAAVAAEYHALLDPERSPR